MQAFTPASQPDARCRDRRGASAGRQVHRRRHRPDAADEGQRRDADRTGRSGGAAALRSIDGRRGGLRLGALARMSDVAAHPEVRARWPVIVAGAAGFAPRRRCATWARSAATCCSARAAAISATPASPATSASPAPAVRRIRGENRMLAILGGSDALHRHAIASDLAVALMALDAVVRAARRRRRAAAHADRRASIACPATRRRSRPCCEPGEMIAAVIVPASAAARRSHYLKVRDRASFEFALVSAAVGLEIAGGTHPRGTGRAGRRRHQAVAPAGGGGGAARASQPTTRRFASRRGARRRGAQPARQNAFKLTLMRRVRAARAADRRRPEEGRPWHDRTADRSRRRPAEGHRPRATTPPSSPCRTSCTPCWCRARSPPAAITGFDLEAAQGMPGVLAIITPENAPKLPSLAKGGAADGRAVAARCCRTGRAITTASTSPSWWPTRSSSAQAAAARGDACGIARTKRDHVMDAALDQAYPPKQFRNGARPPDCRAAIPTRPFAARRSRWMRPTSRRSSITIRWSRTRRSRAGTATG